jgi:hypothetical protein
MPSCSSAGGAGMPEHSPAQPSPAQPSLAQPSPAQPSQAQPSTAQPSPGGGGVPRGGSQAPPPQGDLRAQGQGGGGLDPPTPCPDDLTHPLATERRERLTTSQMSSPGAASDRPPAGDLRGPFQIQDGRLKPITASIVLNGSAPGADPASSPPGHFCRPSPQIARLLAQHRCSESGGDGQRRVGEGAAEGHLRAEAARQGRRLRRAPALGA